MTTAKNHYAILTDVTPNRATITRIGEGSCPDLRTAAPIECDELPVVGERVWIRRDGFGVAAVTGRE